jgi:hypothetical protein
MRTILIGTISGLVGVAAGGVIAWLAARSWDNMSDFWAFGGMIMPMMTIPLGCLLVAKMFPGSCEWPIAHRGVFLALAAVGSILAALGALATYVIIVRTWHPHDIDPSLLGFFGDLVHPWTLPEIAEQGDSGSATTVMWWLGPAIGFAIGWLGVLRLFRVLRQ